MQGIRVQSLVQEDPTYQKLYLCTITTEAHVPTACAPQPEKPPQRVALALQTAMGDPAHPKSK